jgi:hypothetical protein
MYVYIYTYTCTHITTPTIIVIIKIIIILGFAVKCSPPDSTNTSTVIVYTSDFLDATEVLRVGRGLKECIASSYENGDGINFDRTIPYKPCVFTEGKVDGSIYQLRKGAHELNITEPKKKSDVLPLDKAVEMLSHFLF